jgi:hypothetical protein
MLRLSWYRFCRTLHSRWGGYVALVLLIGLIGGIAMTSIAAGRRTQSSYPKFLASTNPSDLVISSYGAGAGNSSGATYSTSFTNQIAHLPGVRRLESLAVLNAIPLGPNGAPRTDVAGNTAPLGSVDGLYFNQDRATVTQGRMADPTRADEIVMDAATARGLGLHIGQVFPLGFYTGAQTNNPGFGTGSVPPDRRLDAKLVGIVLLNSQVVQDDTDRASTSFIIFTPAFTKTAIADTGGEISGLQLQHGSRDIPAVEQAFLRLLPPGLSYNFSPTAPLKAKVERAVKPEALALGVFGGIAGMAALFIALQAVARQLRAGDTDLQVLRAMGAGPVTTTTDGLIGVLGAIVIGSLLAAGIAVGLSPMSPLGPVRPLYPTTGIALDWAVLGIGVLALISVLGAMAIALSYLGAPHRAARRSAVAPARVSSVARVAATSGLPAPGVVGMRFALEPGRGHNAAPVRSALLGATLAVVMVVATLTFGSSLRTLVSHPALYGWNWSYALVPTNGAPPQTLALLDHDPTVAGWSGMNPANAQIDGQNVPILLGSPLAAVSPPILSGHALAANNQIVLGAATLALLHKHVGDTAVVSYGTPATAPNYVPPTALLIAGTATLPALGIPSQIAAHPSMGTGALVPTGVEPAAFQQTQVNPDPNLNGPQLVLVRLRPGVSPAKGLAAMQRIADATDKVLAADPNTSGTNMLVLGVQRPAEIVNYRTMGSTPVILAGGLASGAMLALALTLAASVRRRRRDLALLKALGFTRGQLAAAVTWQASIAAGIGIVAGVPLGIALGRQLWTLFARNIDAVPAPTVPVLSVVLVAVGALVFANLVAALPGRIAARTPAALVLRTE